MCALVSFAPTVIICIFSTYFFNFGIQSWFDQKINNVLTQSVYVAQAYIQENDLRMKDAAISISADLSSISYQLEENQLKQFLNAQTEFRSLDEAIIFQKFNRMILAQSDLSFSLAFLNITDQMLETADTGELLKLDNDKNKIQYLIKLSGYTDSYLIIGKFLDQNIINYTDKTYGAISSYYDLKNKSHILQLNFSIVFILVALILLLASFYVGLLFADRIVQPINKLVIATEKVKKGDLTVQVEPIVNNNNEIDILISAFNIMVKQLDYQQKDLVIAQRALAWSEVARRVAHEINNPLTSIYLSCERLSKKFTHEVSETENFQKYINNIFRLSGNIKNILSEFVNFARLPEPIFSEFELVAFIQDIIQSRYLLIENINYSFETNLKHLKFNADPDQLNQVLLNLLKNSEESIIEHKKIEKWIKIKLYTEQKSIILEVLDSGAGFASEHIDKVSQAYFTTKTKGTGLGLAIVKKIIQDHKGVLKIENNTFGGAKITIIFENGSIDD